jgi:hypothetical protein
MTRAVFALLLCFFALNARADGHWILMAQADGSTPGFRSYTTWYIDSDSPKNAGDSRISALIRMTTISPDSTSGLGTIIALERAVFDCAARRYFIAGGTNTSLDHGKVTSVGPISPSNWIDASPQNANANRLVIAVCAYIFKGQ